VSHLLLELLAIHVHILEDFSEQSWTDGLSSMHGNDCPPTVRMSKKMVAAFDANHVESRAPQYGNNFTPS